MKASIVEVNLWRWAAKKFGYRLRAMADELEVSERWLEVCFERKFGAKPKTLFDEWSLEEILEANRQKAQGKIMAADAGLRNHTSLCRKVKGKLGKTLSELRQGIHNPN